MFRHSILLAVVALLFANRLVLADSIILPGSYTTTTPDGTYLFVMIGPDSPWEGELSGGEHETQQVRIRNTYGQSGLYRNDGSTTPLWTVDWYAGSVEPLSDGVHLVRHGLWTTSPDSEAVSFFANGTLIRSYTVADLVAMPSMMPRTVTFFYWQAEAELNDASKTYSITTNHGERYLFDVRTGTILFSFSPFVWGLVGAILLVLSAIGRLWWRRTRGSNHPQRSTGDATW